MLPGDIFALISDGFFEYCNRADEQFGVQRIEDLILSHGREPLEEIRRKLCAAVSHFAGGEPQEDDMTIVLARRNANHAAWSRTARPSVAISSAISFCRAKTSRPRWVRIKRDVPKRSWFASRQG